MKDLPPSQQAELDAQVAAIRAEISEYGQSIATCGTLILLCPHVAISGQWGEIAKIAIAQRWSFSFFPNGDVCFANL